MVERTDEGYMVNPDEWTEEVALEMATADGFNFNEDHMRFINEARLMYNEAGTVPVLRKFAKSVGTDKKELFGFFEYGPMKMISKYGGLPKPTGCV